MSMNAKSMAEVFRRYAKKRVLITTHVSPDGDAIGSSVALACIAVALSCDAKLIYASGLPENYQWLDLPCGYVESVDELAGWTPDLVLAADCGDAARTGDVLEAFFLKKAMPAPGWEKAATANIDHHLGNPCFADHNWVAPEVTATGQLAGLLAKELGIELSGRLGEAVYLALVSDSGSFSFSNTGPGTLAMAGDIVAGGLDVGLFTSRYENQWSLGRMKLWGALMNDLALHADGRIALSVVTQAMLQKYDAGKDDLEGFASWMRRVKGVRASLFIREDGPEECKVSVRSMGDVDVRQVAVAFNGGGHKAAAGATIYLPVKDAVKAALERLEPLV